MNRVFVSLYLIIVLSIILLGAALNVVWDVIYPAAEVDVVNTAIIEIAENSLRDKSDDQKNNQIDLLSNNSRYKFQLANISDFSQTALLVEIKKEKIISTENEKNVKLYKKIKASNDVLIVSFPSENNEKTALYVGFLIIFYLAIAAVIFMWVWPISRDLSRLAQHTQTVGKEGIPQTISISSRSVLFPFATAFNSMSQRLGDLINSQKEMTYAVSHELRTPLARMKFALAMSEESSSVDDIQKQLSSVQTDIIDMESLINSLLAYAQFDQHSLLLKQSYGHIQDLLMDIIYRTKTQANSNIKIDIVDQSNGELFRCEWSLMQTALQNLLVNALGYAHSTIIIRLTTTQHSYRIEVEDDGVGVLEQDRERIFESFVRLYTESNKRSGFGLGLALVRRIMGWHKGSVICTSSDLGGALFTLEWSQ